MNSPLRHHMSAARTIRTLSLATAILFTIHISTARAVTRTWDGGGADNNWTSGLNWSGTAPGAGDDLVFAGATRLSPVNDLTAGTSFAGFTFSSAGFSLSGNGIVLAGDITASATTTFGLGITQNGGANRFVTTASGATLTMNGNVNLSNSGNFFQDNSAGTTIYNGSFNSGGIVRIFSTGESVFGGDNSGWNGALRVFRNLRLTNANGLGGNSTTVILDRSYSPGYIDLNGLNVGSVGTLSFTATDIPLSSNLATIRNSNTSTTATYGGNIALSVTGGVDGAGNTTLSGTISGSGAGLIKNGSGILRVSGANTFTNGANVNVGTMLVNNISGSGLGTGPVNVAVGAALGGTGSFTGALTLNNGSVRPGDAGIGTLSSGTATWNGGANAWVFELGTPGVSDQLAITGDFTKGTGGLFSFDFSGTGSDGLYTLATWTGTTTFLASDFSYTNLTGGRTATFGISGSNLQLTVIPEPSSLVLLVLSSAVLLVSLRRSSRSLNS